MARCEDAERWDRFVGAQPGATLDQLYGWSVVARRAYGKACYPLALARGESWSGVLPLVRLPGRMAGDRLVSMPFLDRGGVLAVSADDSRALWQTALELARGLGCRGLEIRGPVPIGPDPVHDGGRVRWTLPLGAGREALWHGIGPKVRNQIRKAKRCGLSTRAAAPADLPRFYGVFSRNMRDLGSPVHAFAFFRETFAVFGPRVRLYLTSDSAGEPVAGAVAFRFREVVAVPWASSLRSVRPSCPNHSLYWRILRDAERDGAKLFDFGRSTVGTGPARFKAQWRTRREPLTWWRFDPEGCPETPPAARRKGAADLAVRLWRHLPLPVANRLGPVIRGRLPH